MLVDEYEQYQNNNNDRTDVVVVSRSGSEEPEPEPAADDRKNLHYSPSFPSRSYIRSSPCCRPRNGGVGTATHLLRASASWILMEIDN